MARRKSRRSKKMQWSKVLIPALAVGITAAALLYLQRRSMTATATSYAMGTAPRGIIDPIFQTSSKSIIDPIFSKGIVDPNFGRKIVDPTFAVGKMGKTSPYGLL